MHRAESMPTAIARGPSEPLGSSGHVRVFLPNGQIMKIKGHTTVAAGRWLKPTSLKRTTSLESVVKGELPLQASHAAPRPATSGMQRPREIQVLDRAGEKQSDRVLHVWRSKVTAQTLFIFKSPNWQNSEVTKMH